MEALSVNGNIYNEEFTAFQNELNRHQTVLSERDAKRKAEEFIRNHPSSFVSLYLLDKFFVRKEVPDFDKIKEFTKSMTGVLQDKSYIEHLNEYIAQAEKIETGKYAPFFSLTNAKGERITRSSDAFKKKNLLINFWASWSDSTARRRCNTELKTLYKKYKGNTYFNMLGVSLDIDKKEWQNAIERDTLSWEQVCDFGGLDSEIAKQYAVSQLPGNILLSADGKILAKDLWGEALKEKIDEAISFTEEKAKKDNRKNR